MRDSKNSSDPSQSQEVALQKLVALSQAFKALPANVVQSLPREVKAALEQSGSAVDALLDHQGKQSALILTASEIKSLPAQVKAIDQNGKAVLDVLASQDAARVGEQASLKSQLVAEIKALLGSEREAAEAKYASQTQAQAEQYGQILTSFQTLFEAVQGAAARDERRDARYDSFERTIQGIAQTTSESEGAINKMSIALTSGFDVVTAAQSELLGIAQETGAEVAAISKKTSSIQLSVDNLDGGLNQLQSSVDRIGEIVTLTQDFTTHIREAVASSQDKLAEIEINITKSKADVIKVTNAYHNVLVGKIDALKHLPDAIKQEIKDLNGVTLSLKGSAANFIKQGRTFIQNAETSYTSMLVSVEDLRGMVKNFGESMKREAAYQLSSIGVEYQRKTEELILQLDSSLKKSDVYAFMSNIHALIEQANHLQAGNNALMGRLESYVIEVESNIKRAGEEITENLSINAKGIGSAVSDISRSVHGAKQDAADAKMEIVKITDNLDKLRVGLVSLTGSLESLMNLQGNATSTMANQMVEKIIEALAGLQNSITDTLDEKFSNHETSQLLKHLDGEQDDDNNNKK